MTRFFSALDGADEPTIWEATDRDPAVVVRRAELPAPHADLLWRVLVGVLCADDETVERLARAIHVNCYEGVRGFDGHMDADGRAGLAVLAALRGEQ